MTRTMTVTPRTRSGDPDTLGVRPVVMSVPDCINYVPVKLNKSSWYYIRVQLTVTLDPLAFSII